MRRYSLYMAGLLLLTARPAAAHIELTSPRPRTLSLKSGPCGEAGSTRGDQVCAFRPGATITVSWIETIDHPGHFRIAFDEDGDDDFFDPDSFDDTSGGPGVMADGIADRQVTGGDDEYSEDITLPAVECDNCTLQVIQVMTDKAPYGDGNDLYYQCADIVLSNDAPADPADACSAGGGDGEPTDDGEEEEEESGCAAGGSAAGPAWLILFALVPIVRRRRG